MSRKAAGKPRPRTMPTLLLARFDMRKFRCGALERRRREAEMGWQFADTIKFYVREPFAWRLRVPGPFMKHLCCGCYYREALRDCTRRLWCFVSVSWSLMIRPGDKSSETGSALRMKPPPRMLRIRGASFGASTLRRSRPM